MISKKGADLILDYAGKSVESYIEMSKGNDYGDKLEQAEKDVISYVEELEMKINRVENKNMNNLQRVTLLFELQRIYDNISESCRYNSPHGLKDLLNLITALKNGKY